MTLKSISALTAIFMMSSSAFAANHSVTIKGFSFSPANLSVTAGDTVTFKNADQAPHTATAKDGSFDTKTIEAGGSKQITITKAGSFDYFCGVHPHMTGQITAQKLASLEGKPGVDKQAQAAEEEQEQIQTVAETSVNDLPEVTRDEVNIDEAKSSVDEDVAAQITAAKRAIDTEAAANVTAANLEAYKAAAAERAAAKIAAYKEKMKQETYVKIKSYQRPLHSADHATQATPSCNKSSHNTMSSSHGYSY